MGGHGPRTESLLASFGAREADELLNKIYETIVLSKRSSNQGELAARTLQSGLQTMQMRKFEVPNRAQETRERPKRTATKCRKPKRHAP